MKMHLPDISRSFSMRLSLFITLTAALLFVITSFIFFYSSRGLIRQEATQHAESTLDNTILRIEKVLNSVEVAVDNMDWVIDANLSNPDSMYGITRRLLMNNPVIVGSAIAFKPNYYPEKGELFSPYSFRRGDTIRSIQLGTEDYEYHYMDWYQIPRLLGRSYWSEPYFDDGGGEMIMSTFSKPLYDEHDSLYAIFTADISLQWLTEMMNGIHPFAHSYNLMIGRGGTYIVHHQPERILSETVFTATVNMEDTTVNAIGYAMVDGLTGMATLQNDDTLSYVFYAPLPTTGWSMAVVCPHKDVFAGVDRIAVIVVLVAVIGLILLLFISVRTIRRITRPLKRFAESAVDIAGGNFATPLPEIRSRDEMWQLYQSFDFMQHSLTGYIEELKTTTAGKERIESELRIASEIQMGMIPKIFPPFPDRDDIDLYATLTPAKEVGGDLYDFFIEEEKLYLTIGDVSGKGVPASLLMAVTRSLFRTVATHLSDPVQIVESINNSISETNESNMFVTLFVAVLDLRTGKLRYCNAGHNPPILYSSSSPEVAFIDVKSNLPVGAFNGFGYQGQEMQLQPGSTLFMYTDGLTEAENMAEELYGEDSLLQVVRHNIGAAPWKVIADVTRSVKLHVGEAEQSDDLTMLAICYKSDRHEKELTD